RLDRIAQRRVAHDRLLVEGIRQNLLQRQVVRELIPEQASAGGKGQVAVAGDIPREAGSRLESILVGKVGAVGRQSVRAGVDYLGLSTLGRAGRGLRDDERRGLPQFVGDRAEVVVADAEVQR